MVFKALGCGLGWFLGLVPLVSALPEKTNGSPLVGSKPCGLLADAGLGGQLFFQSDGEYNKTLETYYGGESKDLRPHCILKPETVEQVTTAIKTLNTPQAGKCWNVAIRAGGHSNFPASNTASGVTIDLVRLNTLNLNDNGTVSIGSGNRWGDVYRYLEPRGIMVAGGRESTVGVSGLLLGGGLSWYSGYIGFAVDSAAAFEVVLADGSVVRAASDENPDLFRALKGGGGNFGLVTKYELRHFPSHNIFGGITIFPYTEKDAIMRKFVEMVDGNANGHPDDSGFAAAAWGPASGKIMSFIVVNTEGRSNTTAFAGLEDLSPLVDMRADLPVTGIAAQITSTSGQYQVWSTLTYRNTPDMGRKILSSFEAVIDDVEPLIDVNEELRIIYLLTPLPASTSSYGDNVLGLNKIHTKSSVIFSVQAILPSTRYRDLLKRRFDEAVADIKTYAKETGQLLPYLYLNYAGPDQDPLAAYGEENIRFMEEVAAKYDPGGFFQYGVQGGFKLAHLR
ncbi:Putative FAD-binding domain, PCMH-type, FAD-binding, type PCMH, subdomain 2 [Colletotrichum destructivum]|uniref:FAD-binding domain, PCMH-type, FAD-binding, type PCMH, subdomain 2 n=1 Tax=Colletotrichum destructivum TaxID=34406 RepID=A0AAX4I0W7_9PEZI|nr:Putative FAD-binding domain, PCMH-type, FAD-binding, type PCMH, subdomain 2 [Colletotrichum destructivum]